MRDEFQEIVTNVSEKAGNDTGIETGNEQEVKQGCEQESLQETEQEQSRNETGITSETEQELKQEHQQEVKQGYNLKSVLKIKKRHKQKKILKKVYPDYLNTLKICLFSTRFCILKFQN